MSEQFLPAAPEDAEGVFALIRERIAWMDEAGLCQWNREDYWSVFPESYYRTALAEGRLFVLKDPESGRISAAGVLSDRDRGWTEEVPALYLHNLAAARRARGAGARFLAQ